MRGDPAKRAAARDRATRAAAPRVERRLGTWWGLSEGKEARRVSKQRNRVRGQMKSRDGGQTNSRDGGQTKSRRQRFSMRASESFCGFHARMPALWHGKMSRRPTPHEANTKSRRPTWSDRAWPRRVRHPSAHSCRRSSRTCDMRVCVYVCVCVSNQGDRLRRHNSQSSNERSRSKIGIVLVAVVDPESLATPPPKVPSPPQQQQQQQRI